MVQAIGTSTHAFRTSAGKLQNVKTLNVTGTVDENSKSVIKFDGKRYRKTEITSEKTGKKEYVYVSLEEEATEIKETERYVKPTTNDGADDGVISTEEKISSFFKGIWNPIKSMFTDKNGDPSLGKTALTVGIAAAAIGACFIPGIGPAISAGLLYGGLALGGITLAKGTYNACTAKTDAEARDAWGDIGNGTFAVVSSCIGIKSMNNAAKAAKAAQAVDKVDDVVTLTTKAAQAADKVDDAAGLAFKVASAADKADDIVIAVANNADDAAGLAFKVAAAADKADDVIGVTSKVAAAEDKADDVIGVTSKVAAAADKADDAGMIYTGLRGTVQSVKSGVHSAVGKMKDCFAMGKETRTSFDAIRRPKLIYFGESVKVPTQAGEACQRATQMVGNLKNALSSSNLSEARSLINQIKALQSYSGTFKMTAEESARVSQLMESSLASYKAFRSAASLRHTIVPALGIGSKGVYAVSDSEVDAQKRALDVYTIN